MSATSETGQKDRLVYIVDAPDAYAYHPKPHCPNLRQDDGQIRRVPESTLDDRIECGRCLNPTGPINWNNGECRSCGTMKVDGECPWCQQFDKVHDVDSRVDIHWLRRTAAAGKVLRA